MIVDLSNRQKRNMYEVFVVKLRAAHGPGRPADQVRSDYSFFSKTGGSIRIQFCAGQVRSGQVRSGQFVSEKNRSTRNSSCRNYHNV